MNKDKAALASERAYRRGFQHGVNAAIKFGVTNDQAASYRYDEDMRKAIAAPEKYADGMIRCGSEIMSLVTRFEIENRDLLGDDL